MTPQAASFQHLVHARQFICGSRSVSVRGLAKTQPFLGFSFSAHDQLVVTTAQVDAAAALCLGHLLDPDSPARTNDDVLRGLLTDAKSFEQLELALAKLGGRWLLFVQFGTERRLYPDAAGTRAAFYTTTASGELWVASQPGLLASTLGIRDDEMLRARFNAKPHNSTSWPGTVTPFDGVKQLLPNHYLDLSSGLPQRFWPSRTLAPLDLEIAAAAIARILNGTISAAVARGTVAMPLTGGFDSRTLFTTAGELRKQIRFFSVAGQHSAHHDTQIPRRLGRKFGVDVSIVRPKPYPPGFWDVIENNTAKMWWDPADYMVYTFGAAQTHFILFGLLAEIARCFYYTDGRHPESLTPRALAEIARYGEHPIAEAAFTEWLADAPQGLGIETLDLFYWEHRAGNWVAMTCTTYDAIAEVIAPFNCRALLEAALAVDTRHRVHPHGLHQRVCELSEPDSTSIPFNYSRLDELEEAIARWVPWRIRNAVRRFRMKLAGF